MLSIWCQEAKGDQDDSDSLGRSACTACWLFLISITREREGSSHATITLLKSDGYNKVPCTLGGSRSMWRSFATIFRPTSWLTIYT